MKSDSPLFDRIRVKPDKDRRLRAQCPGCEWPNCTAPATHRAPKGRLREREYWRFFFEQPREYKHPQNFFPRMRTQGIAPHPKETPPAPPPPCPNSLPFSPTPPPPTPS